MAAQGWFTFQPKVQSRKNFLIISVSVASRRSWVCQLIAVNRDSLRSYLVQGFKVLRQACCFSTLLLYQLLCLVIYIWFKGVVSFCLNILSLYMMKHDMLSSGGIDMRSVSRPLHTKTSLECFITFLIFDRKWKKWTQQQSCQAKNSIWRLDGD